MAVAILLIGLGVLHADATPASAAELRVASEIKGTPLTAFEGHLVWSSYRGDIRRYVLMHRLRGVNRRLAAVESRSVPFDADLGPSDRGGVAVVFSRCRVEVPTGQTLSLDQPQYTAGRGCDIYRLELEKGAKVRKLPESTDRYSEVLPTIWKRQLAFARRDDRVSEARGGQADFYSGRPARRVATGPRGETGTKTYGVYRGGPGALAADLRGTRLVYTWLYGALKKQCPTSGGAAEVTELRVADLSGGRAKTLQRAGCTSRTDESFVKNVPFAGKRITAFVLGDEGEQYLDVRASSGVRRAVLPGRPGAIEIDSAVLDGDDVYYVMGSRRVEIVRARLRFAPVT